MIINKIKNKNRTDLAIMFGELGFKRGAEIGGPVYPVNLLREWMGDGEFDKKNWLDYQKKILN